jgi:Protein of unknown function (DUF2892)
MTQNLSPLERDVRLAVVAPIATLVALGAGITSVLGILAITFAVAMIITSFTGYCPIWDLFEVRSYRPSAT